MADLIVKRADAAAGDRGERLLARGERAALRLWEREPAGETAPEHANPYEYLAYVVEGALRVRIGSGEPVELGAGDSYCVPANTRYAFEVLDAATVVEAVAPPQGLG
jgi:quercetin dioxygenase-like cupin family protein